jgi:hypothetical protein
MRLLSQLTIFVAIALAPTAVASTTSLAEDAYDLAIVRPINNGSLIVFRLNVTSGQVSNVSGSPVSNVNDAQPVPAGKYRLFIGETPDHNSYWLYRLETTTGRIWSYSNNGFTEIK